MSNPMIISSSPRALIGRSMNVLITLVALLILAFFSAATHGFGQSPYLTNVFLLILLVVGLGFLISLVPKYLKIKNTKYHLEEGQITEESYLFRFMGIYRRTAKLGHLKTIECFSNTLWDVWFFNCGYVCFSAATDDVDFVIRNILHPMQIQIVVEQHCGMKSVV